MLVSEVVSGPRGSLFFVLDLIQASLPISLKDVMVLDEVCKFLCN